MVVCSHIEGRLRVRDEHLKQASLLEALRRRLLDMPGVRDVSANARAGSLLVLYRRAQLSMKRIIDFLSDLLGPVEAGRPEENRPPRPAASGAGSRSVGGRLSARSFPVRKAVNIGMLLSLLVSLGALVVDLKSLHILAGVIFVAIFGIHLFDKRRALVA